MTREEKRETIKMHAKDMLNTSFLEMLKKIDKALNSGAINIEDWDEKNAPMYIPKVMLNAILQDEATQYDGRGTSIERKIKKDVKNIMYYI